MTSNNVHFQQFFVQAQCKQNKHQPMTIQKTCTNLWSIEMSIMTLVRTWHISAPLFYSLSRTTLRRGKGNFLPPRFPPFPFPSFFSTFLSPNGARRLGKRCELPQRFRAEPAARRALKRILRTEEYGHWYLVKGH